MLTSNWPRSRHPSATLIASVGDGFVTLARDPNAPLSSNTFYGTSDVNVAAMGFRGKLTVQVAATSAAGGTWTGGVNPGYGRSGSGHRVALGPGRKPESGGIADGRQDRAGGGSDRVHHAGAVASFSRLEIDRNDEGSGGGRKDARRTLAFADTEMDEN